MNKDRSTTITNSQLKEGYKQTEVGVIPEDWIVTPLGELGNFKNGINKNSEAFGHGYPFVNLMDVFGVSSISAVNLSDLIETNSIERQTYNLKEGDVLFIRSSVKPSGVGLTALIEEDLEQIVYSGFLIRFRDGGAICNNFKQHCFYEEGFRRRLISASSVSANTNINQDNLKQLLIPLPPTKAEQEAIACTLSDIDALIRLLTKKLQIKQGAMQELLHPYRNDRLKQGWIFQTIENLCIPSGLVRGPFGGALKKECFVTNGFKVYEQRNAIYKNCEIGSYFINLDKYQELKRFEVKTNDFIISCSGTIGKIYQIPKIAPPGIINQALLKLTIDSSRYSESYFCHYFSWEYFQSKIIDNTQGGAMKNLVGMPIFKATQMLLPEKLEEQIEIANILSDMDAEIGSIESKLTKTRQLKQGMMHELLTGRIRLVDRTNI